MTTTTPSRRQIRRVEYKLGTALTLAALTNNDRAGDELADTFFDRIDELEALLSRFRPDSQLSRVADGRLDLDDADPAVREVLSRCCQLRRLTRGSFEHEPRRASGNPGDPVLDPNALAKGWIIDRAAMSLRASRAAKLSEYFINAGGDVIVRRHQNAQPWRIGVRHPRQADAVVGVLELTTGAIATSGTYERGDHIRLLSEDGPTLTSVSVVGPELAQADALATAVFASGEVEPPWWADVDQTYGLLTITVDDRLRWRPPRSPDRVAVRFQPAA